MTFFWLHKIRDLIEFRISKCKFLDSFIILYWNLFSLDRSPTLLFLLAKYALCIGNQKTFVPFLFLLSLTKNSHYRLLHKNPDFINKGCWLTLMEVPCPERRQRMTRITNFSESQSVLICNTCWISGRFWLYPRQLPYECN